MMMMDQGKGDDDNLHKDQGEVVMMMMMMDQGKGDDNNLHKEDDLTLIMMNRGKRTTRSVTRKIKNYTDFDVHSTKGKKSKRNNEAVFYLRQPPILSISSINNNTTTTTTTTTSTKQPRKKTTSSLSNPLPELQVPINHEDTLKQNQMQSNELDLTVLDSDDDINNDANEDTDDADDQIIVVENTKNTRCLFELGELVITKFGIGSVAKTNHGEDGNFTVILLEWGLNFNAIGKPPEFGMPILYLHNDDLKNVSLARNVHFAEYRSPSVDGKRKRGEIFKISYSDFGRLWPGIYLNDTLVDFYLAYIRDNLIPKHIASRVHIFTSFFFSSLQREGSKSSVSTWSRSKLFSNDFILIPVNQNSHWSIVIICYPKNLRLIDPKKYRDRSRVLMMDPSKGHRTQNVVGLIRQYLEQAYALEYPNDPAVKITSSHIETALNTSVPRQDNAYDCGLYVLEMAERFLMELETIEKEFILAWPAKAFRKSDWFTAQDISMKRSDLRTLLCKLHSENSINYINGDELTSPSSDIPDGDKKYIYVQEEEEEV